MADNKLAKSVSDLVNKSMSDVISTMDELDADALINLKSAVDAEDAEVAQAILDQTTPPVKQAVSARDTLSEINRIGKKNLDQGDPMDRVWELIGALKSEDWNMIWPAVDEEILTVLYMEATDEETDSVSADQSEEIYDYAKGFITESHVIYKNEICEVVIPRGPRNTMGVSYMGKTKMVNKSEVDKLAEHVMGVTAMPALGRMLELAGMPSTVQETPEPDRVYIKGGAGSISKDMMPVKLKRHIKDLSQKVQELTTLLSMEEPDYDGAYLVSKHLEHMIKTITNNIDSAKSTPEE